MTDLLITYFVLPVLAISLVLIFLRLATGPTLPDRVVALDLLVTISIAIISAYSILYDKPVLIDVVVILSLLAFLGTVAFGYYYEKRGKR
jgi:multicomponent Na+:H+ antiporter subunit F